MSNPGPGTDPISSSNIIPPSSRTISASDTENKDAIQSRSSNEDQASPATSPSPNDEKPNTQPSTTLYTRIFNTIFWVPPNCRWDPQTPPEFSISLNLLFGLSGAATVANLYYSHPILHILAEDFGVQSVEVSEIPTLAQAGYAAGLLFLCPLGDTLRRRPFVLSLVFFTATLCIGLAATSSIQVFSAIQFITAVTTVTPQLMMPLVGDLAPPNRRAFALSIVTTGLMLGILLARLLSGIVTQYTSWRTVYWLSVALQYGIFALLWLFMPDYPSTNQNLNYFKALWSIPVMLTKHPVLVQSCIISFFASAPFTNFWTVVTFLLAGPPYFYSPVIIGLFALIGIVAMLLGPLYAKLVTDRFVPLFTIVLGMLWCLTGICIGTYTGTFTVAGPILQALLNDFGSQTSQIANRSSIFTVEPKGRNRVNTAFMVFTFAGQLTGTSVGARLYERGGWVASGSYSVASIGVALLVTIARGPWEEGWVGWHGGWSIWKKDKTSSDGKVRDQKTQPEPLAGTGGKGDVEKNGIRDEKYDLHEHKHGRDDQRAVNRTVAEQSLEMRAAEDSTDDLDERSSSKSKQDDIHARRAT